MKTIADVIDELRKATDKHIRDSVHGRVGSDADFTCSVEVALISLEIIDRQLKSSGS